MIWVSSSVIATLDSISSVLPPGLFAVRHPTADAEFCVYGGRSLHLSLFIAFVAASADS
jgi:hypothetical protein